jgi:23S rRNA pseudouridine2605 synthase
VTEVRLQKVIAAAGLASRREAERLIRDGRVSVNGRRVTTLGTRVDSDRDQVRVDGKPIQQASELIYVMMYKPRGVIAAVKDPQGRQTVMDLLGKQGMRRGARRVFHVGRLDYNSEGLLLFTNDGALAMALTHPSHAVPRVYRARVQGIVQDKTLQRLMRGITLDDGPVALVSAEILKTNPRSTWIEVTVVEGRNHLVRRLFQAVGHSVLRLIRVSYGGVELGDLHYGEARPLTGEEIEMLKGWKDEETTNNNKDCNPLR